MTSTRLAVRRLVHDWRFTAMSTLTLAVAIASATAMFGAAYAVLFRPLPMGNAGRLHVLWNGSTRTAEHTSIAVAEFLDIRDRASSFDAVAAVRDRAINLTGTGEPLRLNGLLVSPELGRVLGVRPILGRDLLETDDDGGRVAILAHHTWRQVFGGDPGVIGRQIELDGQPHSVVGVLPAGLAFPDLPSFSMPRQADVWLPGGWPRQRGDSRGNQILRVVAAVRPGVTAAALDEDLRAISAQFRREFPGRYTEQSGWRLIANPFREELVGASRPALLLLCGGALLVLVIACGNVASLVLARGAARRREIGLMAALGAGRGTLVKEFAIEAAAIAGAAGAAALVLAWWALPALGALAPDTLPHAADLRLDAAGVAIAAVLSALAALATGVVPALEVTAGDLPFVVREPGAGSHGGSRWLRVSLVTGEIGLAFVVVALAGLLVKSAARLDAADLGFSPAGVTLLKISLPTGRYPQADHRGAFFEALLGALRPHPAVEGAALADPAPLGGEAWSATVRVEGHEARPGEALPHAEFYRVSPGFARTLGLRLIDGREFGDRDDGRAPFVVMVDETFAARHWPGERAVGKRVNPRGPNAPWSTVVGVVARVRRDGPRHAGEPQVYLPYFQSRTGVMTLVVRSDLPAAGVIDIVRGVLRAIDPALPVSDVATLPELAARATAADRFALRLTAAFAVCALLLAAVGLYAVVAGLVTERTREIGIRLALGSPPGAILRGVVGQSGRWAAIGVVGGLAAAAAIGRAVRGLLFEVSALDAATLAAAVVVTLLVTLAATWFPARRAAALDPLAALRE